MNRDTSTSTHSSEKYMETRVLSTSSQAQGYQYNAAFQNLSIGARASNAGQISYKEFILAIIKIFITRGDNPTASSGLA